MQIHSACDLRAEQGCSHRGAQRMLPYSENTKPQGICRVTIVFCAAAGILVFSVAGRLDYLSMSFACPIINFNIGEVHDRSSRGFDVVNYHNQGVAQANSLIFSPKLSMELRTTGAFHLHPGEDPLTVSLSDTATLNALAMQYGNRWKDDTVNILYVNSIIGSEGIFVPYKDGNDTYKLIILRSDYATSSTHAITMSHELGHCARLNHVDDAQNVMHKQYAGGTYVSTDIFEIDSGGLYALPQEAHRNQWDAYRNWTSSNDEFNNLN